MHTSNIGNHINTALSLLHVIITLKFIIIYCYICTLNIITWVLRRRVSTLVRCYGVSREIEASGCHIVLII